MSRKTTIETLGASGDGKVIGSADCYIPFTLPNEEILLGSDNELENIITPSPERITPPCEYFTKCGGCRLQHMNIAYYQNWKKQSLIKTLNQKSINISIEEPIFIPAHTRRRAEFAFKENTLFGFYGLKSHKILNINHCQILSPQLEELFSILKNFPWKGQGSMLVSLCYNGIDLFIKSSHRDINLEMREQFAELIHKSSITRITWNNELVLEKHPLHVSFEDKIISFPAGSFLQPSVEGEVTLQNLVKQEIPENAKVLDLFCGLGTFTVPLNATGFDSTKEAIKSLTKAGYQTHVRDLFKDPLTTKELAPYSHVVLDPPRAGAQEQIKSLSEAKTFEKIIYVSCNPATFTRDARILVDSGYSLQKLTPVDQFIYSPYLELVAVFMK